jgi:uncharacterized protein YndB with AHSA1/START domain
MATFSLYRTVDAPIEVVFDVLTDHAGYAKIVPPLRSSTLEHEGRPAPNGVGAIRVLQVAGPPIREQVTEYDRPTRFSYKALSGVPAREHAGTVELTARGHQTEVAYRVTSTPKLRLPDKLWTAVVRPVIGQLLSGVVREAERRR